MLTQWFAAHAALVSLLLAVFVLFGSLASYIAKRTAQTRPFLSTCLSAIAAILFDGVKLIEAARALKAKFPPNATADQKKLVRRLAAARLADPEATGPHPGTSAMRFGFLERMGFAIFAVFVFCCICLVGCTNPARTAADADVLQACVVQHVVEDVDPTFETISTECEGDIAAVEKDVGNQLAQEQAPVSDAGLMKLTNEPTLAMQVHARMLAVHHATDGGAK